MSILDTAKVELEILNHGIDESAVESNKWMRNNILELLEVFAQQGHSGTSAPYCVELFKTLALHKVLTPLTGEDGEWNEVADDTWQNTRCSRVFKTGNGAYDIDGVVFQDETGAWYTNNESRVSVTFPYMPEQQFRPYEAVSS
jgi:hypothetical protein